MRSYPIWNDVAAREYKSCRDWGSRGGDVTTTFVGTNQTNSHRLISTRVDELNQGDYQHFTFSAMGPDDSKYHVLYELWVHRETKESTTENPDEKREIVVNIPLTDLPDF